MSEEKMLDINMEMSKCFHFELMTEQEMRESPVSFNPKIVCKFALIQ